MIGSPDRAIIFGRRQTHARGGARVEACFDEAGRHEIVTSSPKASDLRPLVLLVEDEDSVRRSLQLFLTGRGYRVRAFAAVTPVIADATCGEATLLIADYRLPDGDGITLLTGLRGRGWKGRAVLVTAFPSDQLSDSARSAGYATVIEKPLRHQELLSSLGPA